MNFIEKTIIRTFFRNSCEEKEAGRCVLSMGSISILPKWAKEKLHYLEDLYTILPGVESVLVDTEGSKLDIKYDPEKTDAAALSKWMDTAVDEAIDVLGPHDLSKLTEQQVFTMIIDRMKGKPEGQ